MIITKDKHDISVDFNLLYDYEIKDVALKEAKINVNETSTNIESYIKTYKCTDDSFICNEHSLSPNYQLSPCIFLISADDGVADQESMAWPVSMFRGIPNSSCMNPSLPFCF